jgi:hypothetical protein
MKQGKCRHTDRQAGRQADRHAGKHIRLYMYAERERQDSIHICTYAQTPNSLCINTQTTTESEREKRKIT